VPRSLKFHRM